MRFWMGLITGVVVTCALKGCYYLGKKVGRLQKELEMEEKHGKF